MHGARAVMTHSKAPPEWATPLPERRPKNVAIVAIVAIANKVARTIWALLAHEREYESKYVSRPAQGQTPAHHQLELAHRGRHAESQASQTVTRSA